MIDSNGCATPAPDSIRLGQPHLSQNSLNSASVVVPLVLSYVKVRSVADFGCKHGEWLYVFRRHGVESLFGIDRLNHPERLLIERWQFRHADLAGPIEVDDAFDLAVCLEVAEHLPASAAAPLVATLTHVAPVVLFSAAVPDQGGHEHLNEQPRAYWRELFAAHGFRALDCIRPWIWQDARVAWWYRQNAFLYASERAIAASEPLRREAARPVAADVDLLHVDIVDRRTSVRTVLRRLTGAASHRLLRVSMDARRARDRR
jgi:SAM-dependent methyltransferase